MRSIFYWLKKIWRICFGALLLSMMLLLLFPGHSYAQAILLRADPGQGAILISAPTQVRMWFSEDLNVGNSTAIVVGTSNKRVDLHNAHISPTNAQEMDIALQPLLLPGTYSVLWNTQSASDGYVMHGSFLFSVTEPNGIVPKLNGTLPGQNSAVSNPNSLDGPPFFSFMMVTLIDLGAVFWVGAQLWRTFVLQLTSATSEKQETIEQRAEVRFDRNFSVPLLLLLLLANIGFIVGQALTLTGGEMAQSFTLPGVISLATEGRFGFYWMMREIVLLLALLVAVVTFTTKNISQRIKDSSAWLNLILGMAFLLALTLSGHVAAASSGLLAYAVLLDWLHLLAASLWVGGMIYIATIYLPVLKGVTLLERVQSLVSTLPHYSLLAITGILILLVTGPFDATIHMSSFSQLITTAYGRALLVKAVLVAALLLTSVLHIGLFRPRLTKDYKRYLASMREEQRETMAVSESQRERTATVALESGKLLERDIEKRSKRLTAMLRWEPVLGIAVLICTGLMSVLAGTLQTPTTTSQATLAPQVKTFATTAKTSDELYTIKLTVSPDSIGPNTFTVTVLDSHGSDVKGVNVSIYATMLDMDMGTNVTTLKPDGKGNFSAQGYLDMGGNWGLRLEIRTPDLKLHTASMKIVAAN